MQLKQSAKPVRGQLRGIWDALRAQLRQDGSELARCVRTYQLCEGKDVDLIEPAAWELALFPVLRLDLEGGGGGWQNQATTKFTMRARITLGIRDTDQGDALDWWECVVNQLYPGDRSLYDALYACGVRSYTLTDPAVAGKKYSDGLGQVISGQLSLHVEIRTKV